MLCAKELVGDEPFAVILPDDVIDKADDIFPLPRAAAFEILKKRSDTFYDPLLVANFIRLISEST